MKKREEREEGAEGKGGRGGGKGGDSSSPALITRAETRLPFPCLLI